MDTISGASVGQMLVFTSPTTATYAVSGALGSQKGTVVWENVVVRETTSPTAALSNMSVRAVVPSAGQVIPGLVLTTATKVLVRAGGPALAAFGVSDTLGNPQISLYSGSTLVATNDDWSGAAVADAVQKVGAFPFAPGSRDAALAVDLQPGSYTCMISGVGGASGEVLLEVYRVP